MKDDLRYIWANVCGFILKADCCSDGVPLRNYNPDPWTGEVDLWRWNNGVDPWVDKKPRWEMYQAKVEQVKVALQAKQRDELIQKLMEAGQPATLPGEDDEQRGRRGEQFEIRQEGCLK